MPRLDTFPLVDRLVPGGLSDYIAAARANEDSAETIAKRLYSEHDVNVSAETVRRWIIRCAEGATA